MAKSAQAFRTIREVADWLDVAAHVLRFWESKFSQIKPVKRAGGRRYYRPADMELVGGIKVLLHDRGLTIRGVQKMITEEGLEAVTSLSPPVDELVEDDQVIDGDVIDGDATGAWKDDAAAEALDTPLGQALLGSGSNDTPASPQTSDIPDALGQAPAARAADTSAPAPTPAEPEEPAEPAEAKDVAAPPSGPADASAPPSAQDASNLAASAPMPDLGRLPSSPSPVAAQTPADTPPSDTADPAAPPAHPASDPAEGPLGALTAIAQLPAPKRRTLAPHITALVRLRDRMSAPTDLR